MFEVAKSDVPEIVGAIVEGVEVQPNGCYLSDRPVPLPWPAIGVRVVSDEKPFPDNRHPQDLWHAAVVPADGLRPLTPAARDMLRLVRK